MKEFKKILMSLAVMVMAVFSMSVSTWAALDIVVSADNEGIKLDSITGGTAGATYSVSYSGNISGNGDEVTVDSDGKWPTGEVIESADVIKGKLKALIRDTTQESIGNLDIIVTVKNIDGTDADSKTATIEDDKFIVNKVDITAVADSEGGSVTAEKTKGFAGDTVEITADANDGFVVNYWDINGSKGASSDTTKSYPITDSSNTVKVGFGKVTLSGVPTTVNNGDALNIEHMTSGKKLNDQSEGEDITDADNCYLDGNKIKLIDPGKVGSFKYVYSYGNASATSDTITVKKNSYTLKIDGESKVTIDGAITLTGSVSPTYAGTVSEVWKSSNPSVATVDNNGVVKGLRKGETTITYSVKVGGATGPDLGDPVTKEITVGSKSITKITLPEDTTMKVGDNMDVQATIDPSDATEPITWSITRNMCTYSLDKATNTLNLTAKKAGTITITVTGESGVSDTMKIKVTDPSSTISVSPSSKTIGKGEKQTISAVTVPVEAAAKVTWDLESGSEKYIRIIEDEKGAAVIQGIKATPEGEPAVITATASAYITVVDGTPITKFTLEDVKVTVGFDVPVKATITPKNATNTKITKWEWNGDSIELKKKDGITSGVVVHGKSTVSNLKLKATIEDGEISDDSTAECTVTVYSTPTLKHDSSEGKLSFTLPSQVYTGSDDDVNLQTVKGGYLIASYGGNEVWNSGDKYKDSGTSVTVSNSDLQGIVDSIKDKLSGSTATINFKLYPVGKSVSGNDSKRNSDVAASVDVTAYQVKVYGENITAATYYGIPKASVKITATPITGYSFSKWSDGSTSNPRTVEVSSSESSNSYQAVAVAGVKTAAGQGKAGADGYDRVPRTGEGAEVIVLWIVLILTAIGGFVAYRKLRPQAVVNKDETSKDSKK